VLVLNAVYGARHRQVDVTQRVRGFGGHPFRVTNEALGGDPAPGIVKQLRVTWALGGFQQPPVTVTEGAMLILQAV
jgi:hypothetical protein